MYVKVKDSLCVFQMEILFPFGKFLSGRLSLKIMNSPKKELYKLVQFCSHVIAVLKLKVFFIYFYAEYPHWFLRQSYRRTEWIYRVIKNLQNNISTKCQDDFFEIQRLKIVQS